MNIKLGTISKSELNEMIRTQLESVTGDISKNISDELRKVFDKPIGNKLSGGWPGDDDNKPKQKMHNYDNYELRDTAGFDSFSDYLKAVKENNYSALDKCRVQTKDVLSNQAPGGFLIPTKYQAQILQGMSDKEIIRPLCQSFVLPRGAGDTLTIPVIKSEDFSAGKTANVEITNVAEAGTYGEDTPTVGQISLKLYKIGRTVDFSEEVIFGSPIDMGDFISGIFADAAAFKINNLLLKGTGAGECLGIQNSGDLLSIIAEVGQTTDSLVAENIFSMAKKLIPGAWDTSTFLCSIQNIGELLKFHVKLGTAAAKIDVFSETNGKFTILGRPCLLSQHMGSLGEAHSIMLCNFKKVAVLTRDGMMIRNDQGLTNFNKDLVRFKFTMYLDSQPMFSNYVTLADGNTAANFVTVPAI